MIVNIKIFNILKSVFSVRKTSHKWFGSLILKQIDVFLRMNYLSRQLLKV